MAPFGRDGPEVHAREQGARGKAGRRII